MKTLMEIIKSRKSIRAYQDKPLPKEVVRDILEAAKYAPTARNMQELEYRVITNKALMDKLSKGIADALQLEGLPLKGPPGAKPRLDVYAGRVVASHPMPPAAGCTTNVEVEITDRDDVLAVEGHHNLLFCGDYARHFRRFAQLYKIESTG